MKEIKYLSEEEKKKLDSYALKVIDYRRTGISLNHIIGCPLNCAYCVRHFWGNFTMKEPHLLCTDEEAVKELLRNKFFIKDRIPIQFLHKATDPFLPGVKEHMFCVLEMLEKMHIKNVVMLITRYKITKRDIEKLERFCNIRIVVFFTYSGIKNNNIEPISTMNNIDDLINCIQLSKKVKFIQYWRPLVYGWNDSEEIIKDVLKYSKFFDAIVIKGLRHKKENDDYFQEKNISIYHKYGQYKKILDKDILERVYKIHKDMGINIPIFQKTSCAIAHLFEFGDYNMQIKEGIDCYNCSIAQQDRCNKMERIGTEAELCDILGKNIEKDKNDNIYITKATKEEILFARHFLQKNIKQEEEVNA